MKVGIIDLGSNTFNLLIAEIDDVGNYKELYRSKVGVKLGEGSFEKNYITEEAMQRAVLALEAQIAVIKNQYCDRILAFATSAVRNASNGAQFVKKVKDQFGVNIHVIDGDKEASMIFQGVQMSGALEPENALIMDIGGGSTEFVIANEEEILWKQSFEVGVSRLREKFSPSDPITPAERAEIEAYILGQVGDVFEAIEREHARILIGCSGSFETFNDVLNHREGKFKELSNQSTNPFDLESLRAHLLELVESKRIEREGMEGMAAMRVDLIPLAALFVNLVFTNGKFHSAKLSKYSLKEGVLFDVLKGNI